MAKNTAQTKKARALIDLGPYGYAVPSGSFFIGPVGLVEEMVRDGIADDQADEAAVYGVEAIPAAVEISAQQPGQSEA